MREFECDFKPPIQIAEFTLPNQKDISHQI